MIVPGLGTNTEKSVEQEEEHMRVGSTSARQASRTAISAHQVYQKATADETIEQRVSEMGDRAPGKRQIGITR